MNDKYKKPELVAPAGNWSLLKSAVENGADSVYFGVKGFNMRDTADNFDLLEMGKVMDYLRDNGKKGYLTLNVIIFDKELDKVRKILEKARKSGVDGVILWDMAVLKIARGLGLDIHLSTQASVSNIESLKYYASIGVKRIVLARECTLGDIRAITKYIEDKKIKCGIEVFIHGAMCVSISGRCFLSQLSFGKSANRGECLQPCRREYAIIDTDNELEYILGKNYVLSPRDLCTIDILGKLIDSGIHAFKIEGRARSPEYVKVVTSAYREAIDAFFLGKLNGKTVESLSGRIREVYNRGYSHGFFDGEPEGWISYSLGNEYEKVFVGEVVKFYKKISVAEIKVRKGGLKRGQTILVTGKTTGAHFTEVSELEKDHRAIDEAVRGELAALKVPFSVRPGDNVFLWRRRSDI